MCRTAFDLGITHFDLANNYGPPPGSAEENFGEHPDAAISHGLRDELIISTKAGYHMWPGPYGEWGSRKYLLASLDQSLKRMGLDYVDIFYSHRFDPDTPLEETMGALDTAVRQGKALYVGISSYNSARTAEAAAILRELGTPCLIHQPSYSMLNRWVEEDGLLDTLEKDGIGCIAFSPLAQGMLTDKYLKGIPAGSRATQGKSLRQDFLSEETVDAHPRAERHRQEARPDAGADGDRLGAARRAHDLGADRREPARADPRDRRRAEEHDASARRSSPRSTSTPRTAASISGSSRARLSSAARSLSDCHTVPRPRPGPSLKAHGKSATMPRLPITSVMVPDWRVSRIRMTTGGGKRSTASRRSAWPAMIASTILRCLSPSSWSTVTFR